VKPNEHGSEKELAENKHHTENGSYEQARAKPETTKEKKKEKVE